MTKFLFNFFWPLRGLGDAFCFSGETHLLYTEDTREKVVAVINKVLDTNKDCSCEVELKALLTKALTNLIKPTPNLNVKPPEVIMVS